MFWFQFSGNASFGTLQAHLVSDVKTPPQMRALSFFRIITGFFFPSLLIICTAETTSIRIPCPVGETFIKNSNINNQTRTNAFK